jgi:hypothetical protein
MRTEFTSLPKAFRSKKFETCDIADYMNLLLDLGFKVPPRGVGVSYIFSMALFFDARCSLALFVLRERDTLLLKQAVVEIQPDAISFGAPETFTYHEFNRIPLPVIEHIPLVLLEQQRVARKEAYLASKVVH